MFSDNNDIQVSPSVTAATIYSAPKVYFIITCHGWSASNWTATALSKHPDILCCHSAMNVPADSKKLKETEDEFRATMVERHEARIARGELSINQLLDEVESYDEAKNCKVYGNIHTLRLRDLKGLMQKFGQSYPYVLMNQIRHPVSLVASGFGQVKSMLGWDIYCHIDATHGMEEHLSFFLDIAERYKINLCDYDVRSFSYAAHHLLFIAADAIAFPDVPTIIMERATADRDYFANVVRQVTSGFVEPSESYLDDVFKLGQLNQHKVGKKLLAKEQFNEWNSWQQEVFKYFFEKSGLREKYEKYGYDFSFF
ncbi:hypothetical protein [Kiloniella majae]|uniref:hypothetical protein n=1 Tax=Kiloniella majae TaxID=1938558 RepID=UPI000A2784DE|nr:hypothetical protein [Kiloniella majae]